MGGAPPSVGGVVGKEECKGRAGDLGVRGLPCCFSSLAPSPWPVSARQKSGEGGIRTLETGITRLRDFQSRSFDHSDTSPIFFPLPGSGALASLRSLGWGRTV